VQLDGGDSVSSAAAIRVAHPPPAPKPQRSPQAVLASFTDWLLAR